MENNKAREWPPFPNVIFEDDEPLTPRQLRKYGYQLKRGSEYRLYSLSEIKKMIMDGRVVPIKKRPKKAKKHKEVILPPWCDLRTITPEENKEAMHRLRMKIALVMTTDNLQKLAEKYLLQEVLEEYDVTVSWDDEKKKVVVVTSPRRPAKSKKR